MMLCPTCGRDLNKIAVVTRQGEKFDVDHCGYCGGTWFDPYEINRIPFHEVVHLAGLTVLPSTNITRNKTPLCPTDNTVLEPFKGEAVPAKVRLLWCRKCLGIWATQKDLLEFKKHQEETISAYDEGSKFFPALSVVFVPALTFVFLLAATFGTISTLQNNREQRIFAESQITNINISNLSANSVLLSFNTGSPFKAKIFYGPSSFDLKEITLDTAPETIHNIVLPGIIPGEVYIYKIRLTDENGKTVISDIKTFSLPE